MVRFRQFAQLLGLTIACLVVVVLLSRAFVTVYGLVQRLVDYLAVGEVIEYALAGALLLLLPVLLVLAGRWLARAKPEKPGLPAPAGAQSVLVYINGGWQPALLIERTPTGAYVVYVPHVPDARSGTVYVVEAFQVTPLDITTRELRAIIRRVGKGLSLHAGKLFEAG